MFLQKICRNCLCAFSWKKRKNREGLYCGSKCRNAGNSRVSAEKRGEKQRKRTSGSYYIRFKTDHEHRIVMERYLGRKLYCNEIVHHVNGNKKDNRLENLEVMSRQEHIREHLPEMHKKMLQKHNAYFKHQKEYV